MPDEQKKAGTRLAVSAALITISFSASRILGYVRLMALAKIFGATFETDAYISSFNVIDFLYFLLAGGALSAAFIPVFTEYIHRDDMESGWRVVSNVLNVLVAATVAGLILWEIFTPQFVHLMVRGYDAKTSELCIHLTRLMLPMIVFTVGSALSAAILNAFKIFSPSAYAYVFYNLPIIFATFVLGPRIGIVGLVYGVLVGAAGLVFIQLPSILKLGVKYHFTFSVSDPSVRKMIGLFIPATLGLCISQFNLIFIPQFFASHFSHGVVTYFNYANRVIMLPFGIFAVAVSTVVFPTLSELANKKDDAAFKKMLARGISATFFFSFFSTAVLVVLREPVIEILYRRGKFSMEDVHATATILMMYSFGLFALSGLQTVTRGFYALKDAVTPVYAGFVCLFINVVTASLLTRTPLAYGGIPVATSLAFVVNLLLLFVLLRRKLGDIEGKTIFVSFAKQIFASLIFAAGMYVSYPVLFAHAPSHGLLKTAIAFLACTGFSGSIFVALCMFLRVEEIHIMFQMVKSKVFRKK